MKKYKSKETILAVQWKTGVKLPNCPTFEFPKQTLINGDFPTHALVVIDGKYLVIFENEYVIYENEFGNPVGIKEELRMYSEFPDGANTTNS